MIVFDSASRILLRDYGILIPIAPDRAERVLAQLRESPGLSARPESEWLREADGTLLTRADLERAHSPEYVRRMFGDEIEQVVLDAFELIDEHGEPHRYDPSVATRSMRELFESFLAWGGQTYRTGALAGEHGFAYHMGGGAHHGHYSFGHGFCIINDLVVAIRRLQSEEKIRSAWVIDIDAHKGDGTAALTAHDRSITTLSIHMATSWPLDLPRYDEYGREHPSYIASDIDIPISASENPEYLPRLRAGLKELSGRPKPDLVYVVGGVDPYEFDGLPSTQELQLSLDQLYERDVMVFDFLREMNVPQAWLMAGGYGERAWEPYVPYLEYALDRTMSAGAQSAG